MPGSSASLMGIRTVQFYFAEGSGTLELLITGIQGGSDIITLNPGEYSDVYNLINDYCIVSISEA